MAVTEQPAADASAFYARLMQLLREQQLPHLVGGTHGFSLLTGIERPTKDLDLFIRRADWDRLAQVAGGAGWLAELSYPHWLGKVRHGPHFVDIIFSSGNGLSAVDDEWFAHAIPAQLMGQPVRLVPAEESLWTKAFVMERERFDGADFAHLVLACAPRLDWQRLVQRFGPHWRVLLAHLVLFGFIYPGRRTLVPTWLMDELLERARREAQQDAPDAALCAGTLLSREQYLSDVEQLGYQDARLLPRNPMSSADVADWTAAIGQDDEPAAPAAVADQAAGSSRNTDCRAPDGGQDARDAAARTTDTPSRQTS
jgi:hypothetical protein